MSDKNNPSFNVLQMCGTCGTVRNLGFSSAGEEDGRVRYRSGNPFRGSAGSAARPGGGWGRKFLVVGCVDFLGGAGRCFEGRRRVGKAGC